MHTPAATALTPKLPRSQKTTSRRYHSTTLIHCIFHTATESIHQQMSDRTNPPVNENLYQKNKTQNNPTNSVNTTRSAAAQDSNQYFSPEDRANLTIPKPPNRGTTDIHNTHTPTPPASTPSQCESTQPNTLTHAKARGNLLHKSQYPPANNIPI